MKSPACFLIILFIIALPGYSQVLFDKNKINLAPKVLHFEDATDTLEIDQLLGEDFTPYERRVINFGFNENNHWFKITILNPESNIKTGYININFPPIDSLTLYEKKGADWIVKHSGDGVKFSEKNIQDRAHVFRLDFTPKESKTLYLKVNTQGSAFVPLHLLDEPAYYKAKSTGEFWYGVFFGTMVLMAFYNLLLFIPLKDKNYLYYFLAIVFTSVLQFIMFGHAAMYVWPDAGLWWNNYSLTTSIFVASGFVHLFALHFLDVKNFHYSIYKYLRISSIISFLMAGMGFFISYSFLISMTTLYLIAASASLIVCGVVVWLKGNKFARFFVFGWTAYLISIILMVLQRWVVLPSLFFAEHGLQIGSILEVLLLSFALADRIYFLRKERDKMYQKNLHLVNDQNEMLEQRVKEKTRELSEAYNNLKNTQSQLIQAEKMASLGVLSAGIGHEINNPLNYIKNGVKILEEDLKENMNQLTAKSKTSFAIINEGVERATKIINSLSHYSRIGRNNNELCNLHDIIDNCLTILHNKIKHKVSIDKKYADEPVIVLGNEGKLHQSMINLLANAEEAIQEEGIVTIETSSNGKYHHISIKDTGIGINKEHLDKVTDPFFTTKPPGKGTGLGLWITSSIIHEHQGKISIESEEGKGSVFTIILPKHDLN